MQVWNMTLKEEKIGHTWWWYMIGDGEYVDGEFVDGGDGDCF